MPLQRGDVIRLETSGGGGHGDPKARPRDALKADIEQGYVTAATATHYNA
jgi:N-methylhydantoinase B